MIRQQHQVGPYQVELEVRNLPEDYPHLPTAADAWLQTRRGWKVKALVTAQDGRRVRVPAEVTPEAWAGVPGTPGRWVAQLAANEAASILRGGDPSTFTTYTGVPTFKDPGRVDTRVGPGEPAL